MRSSWILIGTVALLAVAAGCDTTEPLQLSEQNFQFRVEGLAANIHNYHVWDMFEDKNDNGEQDADEPTYYYCEDFGTMNENPISAPFGFTVQASILRAGTTTWQPITSSEGLTLEANLSLYDSKDPQLNLTPTKLPITIMDGLESRTFIFASSPAGRRMLSGANRIVVSATENPLHDFDPVTYPLGDGLCSTFDPGEARVDNQPLPFGVTMEKGDSLKVELRRAVDPPQGIAYVLEPVLRMQLLLGGQAVTVEGDFQTDTSPGSGASFTYTFR